MEFHQEVRRAFGRAFLFFLKGVHLNDRGGFAAEQVRRPIGRAFLLFSEGRSSNDRGGFAAERCGEACLTGSFHISGEAAPKAGGWRELGIGAVSVSHGERLRRLM